MQVIVGIDPGQVNMGLAKIIVCESKPLLFHSTTTAFSWELLRDYIGDAKLVVIEEQPVCINSKIPPPQVLTNAYTQGLLEGFCHALGKDVLILNPHKVFAQCKKKSEHIPFCVKKFGFEMAGKTHHEADAILMATHGVFPKTG